MKKYLLLLALVCLLGNRGLAQSGSGNSWTTTIEVKETIDFTGLPKDGDRPSATIQYGDNYKITGISLNNGENRTFTTGYPISISGQSFTTLTTDPNNLPANYNGWGVSHTIAASYFGNAHVGDIIRVNYTNRGNDYNPWFKYMDYSDFTELQSVKKEGNGYFQAAINQDALTYLQANGLRFQGTGFTMTSVELIGQATNAYPGNTWQLYSSGTHNGETYLQKHGENKDYFSIANLQAGDEVTIWGDNGNSGNNAGCRVTSGNTDRGDIAFSTSNHNEGQVIKMQSDGTLQLEFFARYAGIRKIEIKKNVDQTNIFDYDPGYEEYDMYDEFSWEKNGNPATTYNINSGSAGFQLNGKDANYVTFSGSKITTNNRIALTGAANEWTFDFGLVPPGNNGDYSYFSICNLREGDRVVISYINESENPLIFASGENNGEYYYDGCAAFKDDNRNGVLNEGEEYISNGDPASIEWHRGEGNVGNTDRGWGSGYAPELYYINSYVIAQDGHLDLAFRRFVENDDASGDHQDSNKSVSRIVKIKIYSDHQAMMVDDYDNGIYTAHFDITGHLQAKEHIMPGGLEIHVGNDDNQHIDQHAIVVYSKDGPVSYVNAVDGFKLPGVSGSAKDGIQINFDLGINGTMANLPTSGTYYRFIPETSGKMRFMFEAKSMNYYRWDLPGHGTYYNTDLRNGDGNLGNWSAVNDRPNEQTVDAACPYYLVRIYEVNGQKNMQVTSLGNIYNGHAYEHPNEISVTAGEEYYLFGGWNQSGLYYNSSWTTPGNPDYNSDASNKQYNNIEFRPMDGRTVGCGVAELLWVKFKRNDEIYPLAKWVPNNTTKVNDDQDGGVPNPDTYEMEYELANIVGFTNYDKQIMVKKMSGNITDCHPYIKRDTNDPTKGKLMIDGITFAQGKNPGGTILIKIGDATKRTDPLYSLTIAYSTDPQYDSENTYDHRGHIWNFYKESLNALVWNGTTANGAVPTPYGTYFQNYYNAENQSTIENASTPDEVQKALSKNENSILYDEVTNRGDWLFNYNLMYDQNLYDPIFTNKYDMEGDNADMIWDTEGTVFQTSANQSGIFNEYTTNSGTVQNTETTDPNRYVAILKGGKFRIPWLEKNDRVIIWMGAGKGRTNDFVSFKIKNALDAVHNPISENDEYIVGGSQWSFDGKQTNDYHGCYHFFATGRPNDSSKSADMVFEMVGGEMCKIYKIQIYRGDRIITNEIKGETTDDKFLLWSSAADPNDDSSEDYTEENRPNWTLKYLGKDQQLANGTGKNTQKNEIIAQTGKYSGTPALTNNLEVVEGETTSKVESFTYKHQLGEIGTFRMRGKDMEKNMNYVADYADHNVTVAYQETQKYPYTWDFKDMVGYSKSDLVAEDAIEPTTMPEWFDDEDTWKASYEFSSADLSLWETDSQDKTSYYLRLNSQVQNVDDPMEGDNIFETAKDVGGNQVWANDKVVPETKGLWFYTDDNLENSCEMIIYNKNNDGGMQLNGNSNWAHKLVVPNVPQNAAVYLRMKKSHNFPTFTFVGSSTDCEIVTPQVVEEGTDYILAVQNNGAKRNLVFALGGYELKKLAVSEDPKQIGKTGFATESRARDIDHNLTAYLTGKKIKAYTAKLSDDHTKVVLTQFGGTETAAKILEASQNGAMGGCILYHDGGVPEGNNTNRTVSILGGGFHEFVADMHDKDSYKVSTTNNIMKSFRPITGPFTVGETFYVGPTDGSNTNLVLSAKKYNVTVSGASAQATEGYDVFFVRVDPNGNGGEGATLKENSAYIQLPTSEMKPWANGVVAGAKLSIVFEDELFGETNSGIATGISEAAEENGVNDKAEWYSLDGQKLNGVPTAKGLYIVNGKKVLVK